ncbi:ceramide glucosyltransferase [Mytilus galloprovincialis]|uniref:Ceramide glucosyltransferase n=1 Tax=Mytilus galloprovincialis TaxID=29158 RepID=A0A8B6EBX0_MYTGA|nr:ceramide glucosyltransferase [Mytilus galloprovincialis]
MNADLMVYILLVRRLEERFGSVRQQNRWLSRFEMRTRNSGETVAALGDDLRQIDDSLAQEVLALNQLYKSIPIEMKCRCEDRECKTVADAVDIIERYEALLGEWCKLRTSMTPATIFFEPFSQCIVQGCLNAWAMSYLFNFTGSVVFLVHCLVWFLLDYILIRVIEGGPLPFSKFEFLVGWIINEVTYPGVILRSHFDPKIVWRNHQFKLKWGGTVEELHSKQTV